MIQNQKNLVLLHGPAIVASRKHLVSIKDKFLPDDILVFEKGFKEEDFKAALSTISMFTSSRLIILENPGDDFFVENLTVPSDTTVVIWVDREMSSSKKLAKFISSNNGQIVNFPEGKEVSIFPFLDLLAARDVKAYVELEKIKKAGFDIFYIITMVLYLLRNLVVTPKNAPSFVAQKVEKQRKNFSKKQIKQIYKDVLELDYKLKSGLIEKSQAEFFLIRRFMD